MIRKIKKVNFYGRLRIFYPRFQERAFWVTQGLIFVIAALHGLGEVLGIFPNLGPLYFVTILLFFIPLIYAALHYGFAGATATAVWVMIVTTPDWALWHHSLNERLGVILLLIAVNGLAVYIGIRVDREKVARLNAEAATDALRVSEENYRSLFEYSPVPVLVLDSVGEILDLNPEARTLFGTRRGGEDFRHLADLIGEESSRRIIGHSSYVSHYLEVIPVENANGSSILLKPSVTRLESSDGRQILVVFRDVTDEHYRHVGLRTYAASLIRTQEEERQRIARELHDDTIQSMVTLCRLIDSAELDKARKAGEEIVNGLRIFTTSLRPPSLDLGIVSAMSSLLRELRHRSGIETEFRVDGKYGGLSPDMELGIFRIAQEALRNAEKHSKANRIVVSLSRSEDELKLEVHDNGTGFKIMQVRSGYIASRQLGLIGMRERAELLGGTLEIESSNGVGTKVTLAVPVTGK